MNGEFDLMVKTMALIDKVLADNPRAKAIVEQASRDADICRRCEQAPRYRDDSENCMECDIVEAEYDRERKEDR